MLHINIPKVVVENYDKNPANVPFPKRTINAKNVRTGNAKHIKAIIKFCHQTVLNACL